MRLTKILPLVTLLLAIAFSGLALLIRPLWYDVNDFLGTEFPIMAAVTALGGLFVAYAVYLYQSQALGQPRPWRHFGLVALVDIFMLALLYVFFDQLGAEQVMIWRNLEKALPWVAWLGAAGLAFWWAPPSRKSRTAILLGLALAAILWRGLPVRVAFTTRPAVFLQQNGVDVIWGTNMRAVSWVDYGPQQALGIYAQEQANGLKVTGDRLQRVFLPLQAGRAELYLRASVEGVRSIYPIDAVKPGQAQGPLIHVNLPASGGDLSFVAFSDLHEQDGLYARLAGQIDWPGMDMAVYLGDLLNHVADAPQVDRSILALPTGGLDLPRVFVRGNHETRGEAARSLDEWLLPPGGHFYYTFQAGDAFFIVLDSGEGETDSYVEYSGLVNFADYHREQAAWLQGVFNSPEFARAAYRIVLMHIPPTEKMTPEFSPVFDLLTSREDIDLVMGGHTHAAGIKLPEETGLPFPVTICGGSEKDDMAAVSVQIGRQGLQLSLIGLDGSVWESQLIPGSQAQE
jgi:predicted MPP superfamily phosphohydrolase